MENNTYVLTSAVVYSQLWWRLIAHTASARNRRTFSANKQNVDEQNVDEQKKQPILDLPKIIAVGTAAPVATILTSRFGVAGTLIGLALSTAILTALADILNVYLARASAMVAKVPETVVKMPGGLRARLSWRNIRGRLRAAFARFSTLPPAPARRRSILIGSVIGAVISFLVGLIIVTGLELSVGKSLSCWVWNDCPGESSTDDGDSSSRTSTLPSIVGGGPSASSGAPELRPVNPQQQPALPSLPESPLAAPDRGQDQSSPREEDQQQSPSSTAGEDSQGENRSSRSQESGQNTREPEFPSVPWTT